jgi:hypothetical protein
MIELAILGIACMDCRVALLKGDDYQDLAVGVYDTDDFTEDFTG